METETEAGTDGGPGVAAAGASPSSGLPETPEPLHTAGASERAGGGPGDGDLADGGGRGDTDDGDGAAPRAAERGRGGARAGYGADGGVPGVFVPRAEGPLRGRLDALRELVGLSRTRLDGRTLAEAGRVLDEAADRQRLSLDHAVVAIAGATGSGKSSLFNALAGTALSEVGVRRPTTSLPAACAWRGAGDHTPTLLLERLGLPPRAARPVRDDLGLRGLVLVDLPDHDSAVDEHRARVEQLLRRVDAVIWVVDPEKYADAALHERYLQPLAGYAEVTFVVLNQVDRLPAHAVGQVLDDLRRLLDEDGLALGEHGEPGACVLSLSALTGEGVADLRAELVAFIAERRAAERRLTADVDGAMARLREVYVGPGGGGGLNERVTAEFEDRLAEAVGAAATGQAAEQLWLREAEEACGARLVRLWRRRRAGAGAAATADGAAGGDADGTSAGVGTLMPEPRAGEPGWVAARAVVEQAVRAVADEAGAGLPAPWAKAVREAGVRGAAGLADGLTENRAGGGAGSPAEDGPESGASAEAAPGAGAGADAGTGEADPGGPGAAEAGAGGADAGDEAGGDPAGDELTAGDAGGDEQTAAGADAGGRLRPGGVPRPRWWSVAGAVQSGLLGLQALAALWLVAALFGVTGAPWLLPLALLAVAAGGGPGVALACRFAARGPARRYGEEAERRLRESAAASGRARVLEPMAAELLRYREVREQYAVASGGDARL
ncbi:GTPase [Streptomyces sp. MAR4 CNX-425]|uniref:GTPase n=1 Tax=Streptomyces sp. MAR4 CNX-425 TaxID=3406343 RepID=UPI003B50DF36